MYKPPFSYVFNNTLLLILSGFPFQIYLKQQYSLSFVYLSGNVQEQAMNVNLVKSVILLLVSFR